MWIWQDVTRSLEDPAGLVELEWVGGPWWVWRMSQSGVCLIVVRSAEA